MMEQLTGTHLRYLLAIHELTQSGETVSSVRVAQQLQVSKPSVTRMLGILTERELVDKERYGKVCLSPAGREAAERYQDQLTRLMERIPALGLPLDSASTRAAAEALAAVLPERCLREV